MKVLVEGSLEVNLSTIWTDGKTMKSRGGKSQRRERKNKENQRRERVRRKKMQVREKVEKSVFPICCGSRLAKAPGAEPSDERSKNCTPLARSRF